MALACLLLAGSAVLYLIGGSGGGHAASPPTTHAPSTQPVTDPTTSATQSPSPAQPAGVRMTVTAAQGSCWLEARRGSAGGTLLAERTLAPGQAVRLHGRRVWLRLGDPTSVRLRVNGRTLSTAYPAQPINLLVTPHGRVLEAPTSSMFWIKDGSVLTPPLGEHILASITRRVVIDVSEAAERECTLEELMAADEVFLASTVREVQPVVSVDDRSFTAPGPVSERLSAQVQERIQEQLSS